MISEPQLRKYEIMVILNHQLVAEQIAKSKTELKDIFVTLISELDWGVKTFAYPINKMSQGYYLIYTGETTFDKIKQWKLQNAQNKDILRTLIINLENERKHPLVINPKHLAKLNKIHAKRTQKKDAAAAAAASTSNPTVAAVNPAPTPSPTPA